MSEVIDISKVNAALAANHSQLGCNVTELTGAIRRAKTEERDGVNALLARRIAAARKDRGSFNMHGL